MSPTERLLVAIVENARMGADACEQLLDRADAEEIRQELMRIRGDYQSAAQDAEARIYALGSHPHPKGPVARAGMWMGMQLNTLTDHSASHLAELVIQGATMGIVEVTKARNSFAEADAEAQGMASSLLTRQQEAIDRLKAMLALQGQI